MNKETKLKIQIAEAAAERFVVNRWFTFESLAEIVQKTPSEIMTLFPSRSSILDYYYESRLVLFADQSAGIPEYSDFTLQEKVSTLIFSLLEHFREHRTFVIKTYKNRVVQVIVKTNFENQLQDQFRTIFEHDKQISGTSTVFLNKYFYRLLVLQFHGMICFWGSDKSTLQENTHALVDKWCVFLEELFYSKITDKGVDLGKFLLYNSPFQRFM